MRVKILFFLICLCLSSIAQTQNGYVKTKGRLGSNGKVIKGIRLSGVTVTVKGRNAVVSGNNGTFTLAIPSNKYYLQNVQKKGLYNDAIEYSKKALEIYFVKFGKNATT